jgi:tRNA G18 (ribose-2'-O)-methylase SpoU
MPRDVIHKLTDLRLAPYAQLPRTNATRSNQLFVAEGEKVVERLIASDFQVDSLVAEEEWADRFEPRLPAETDVYVVSRELLTELVGFRFHRGVLACGRRKPTRTFESLLPDGNDPSLLLICDAVQDPTNLGSIVRTAAAMGVTGLILGPDCADPFSRRVLRVSMGSALFLPLRESADLSGDLSALGELGFDVVGTVLDPAAIPLGAATRAHRMALLLGSEGHGLAADSLAHCTRRITLPMQAGIDSLNVAIAAAVFLYHFAYVAAPLPAKDSPAPGPTLE